MSLKDDLQEISGIGPATSEEIVEVVEQHTDSVDSESVEQALFHLEKGRTDKVRSFLEGL